MKTRTIWLTGLLLLSLLVSGVGPRALAALPEAGQAPVVLADGPEWTWQNPLPQGHGLHEVWGSGPDDVFAVGEYGTILHYDGVSWYPMSSGTTATLNGVWGSSSRDVFAVGEGGKILHYDGSQWSSMASGSVSSLHAVWGRDADDVFTVGSTGTILHYDGSEWRAMGSGTQSELGGVWGSADDDVFAVGNEGTIVHYSGDGWTVVQSGGNASFSSVWGSSSTDVFVAGFGDFPNPGLILHYDGTNWDTLDSGTGRGSFSAVWGSGPNEVFAVSSGYDVYGFGSVYRYDGDEWTPMDDSHMLALLRGIWGSSSEDVFVVGGAGTILHYDGSQWSEMSTGATDMLYDVHGSSAEQAVAVAGTADGSGRILHYDGNQWITVDGVNSAAILGVWTSSPNDVIAVGIWGTILHYDGSGWIEMSSPTTEWLHGVWGSGSRDVFAVGEGGTILHYDGDTWTITEGPADDRYEGIWGSGPNDVFVVGLGGIILHYDGRTWVRMDSGTTESLHSIWGSGPEDVFAVGAGGVILHYDGGTWHKMNGGTIEGLHGVWGSGPDDVFAVGGSGTILHYDGTAWREMSTGTGRGLIGVWGSGPDNVFAVGGGGTVLRYGGGAEEGAVGERGTATAKDANDGVQPQATTEIVKWIVRVSVASDGIQGNEASGSPSISRDGRFIAFSSRASNLVAEDTNESGDIFVHDLRTRETIRVSISSGGLEANGHSSGPSISADGRYVAFSSAASNLASLDTNDEADVFVHDLQTGETSRVSVSSTGEEGNGGSDRPLIAGDGRYVAFVSTANNLVPSDTNACGNATEGRCPDVFVHDRETGETELVSVASDGTQADGETAYESFPSASDNGRFIAFNSWAPLVGQNPQSSADQVYVRDREKSVTEIINPDSLSPSHSWYPSLSADGRYVAFISRTYMTISGEGNLCRMRNSQECPHVYVFDTQSEEFVRVSENSQGQQALDGYSGSPQISADGNFVVFSSVATNLVPNDTNTFCEYDSDAQMDDNCSDIFLHNLATSETFRASVRANGIQANGGSGSPSVSAQGNRIAFFSSADNLVDDDTNDAGDIFVVGLSQDSPPPFLVEEDLDEAPMVMPETATPTARADAPAEPEPESSIGVLDSLLERPVWMIGLGLGFLGFLGVVGVIAALLLRRYRPSAGRLVWLGCGAGVLMVLLVAALAVAAVAVGSRWQETVSPEIEGTSTAPSAGAEEITGSTPLSSPADEPAVTATGVVPTRESPTITPTVAVPSANLEPSPSPDPLAACADAPQQGLAIGDQVYVCTRSDRLKLRSQPSRSGDEVVLLDPGKPITVRGGPACADGWLWWEVETETGTTGWAAEGGDEIDPYFICETQVCEPVRGAFAEVWPGIQQEIGCATSAPFQGLVAEERFEGGVMLWREDFDTGRVPVLFNDGTWRYYTHTPFVEGSPEFPCVDENTPPQCPPTPKRGFGTMWCDIPGLRDRLGNAVDCERGYQGTMQSFTDGFMLLNDRGTVYVLFDDGTWRRLR